MMAHTNPSSTTIVRHNVSPQFKRSDHRNKGENDMKYYSIPNKTSYFNYNINVLVISSKNTITKFNQILNLDMFSI